MNSVDITAASLSSSLRRSLGASWPLLIGLAGFLVPVAMGWGLQDGDTYLHIAAGRWMLTHGQILTYDPFSFTRHGAPWSAQEWGSDLLIAATFRAGGWSGLVVLTAICFGASLAWLMRFLQSRMEPLYALSLTMLTAMMLLPSLLARPHELVWPLTAVWVGTLVRCAEEHRAPRWWLLVVMLLWVNMHGSFIIAPALAIALAVDAAVDARAKEESWWIARRWLPFILAALACMFVNPQGYRLVLFPFHLLAMKSALSLIAEWSPPSFAHPQILGVWIVAIVGLALWGRIRLSFVRSILVIGLMYTALQHARNGALLGLISPFLLAGPIGALRRQMPVAGRDAGAVDRWFRDLSSPARPFTVCAAWVLAGAIAVGASSARKPAPPEFARPQAALDAVLARAPGARILNDPAFGHYMIYRGVPDFMDGRVDLYGGAFMAQTAGALALLPGSDLGALLRQYRIDAVLLSPKWPAAGLLDRLPGWERVYADKVAVACIRKDARRP